MGIAAPEVGHLVRLRGGMWVVSDVRPSAVEPSPRNGSHLVEAVSIDDDSHGETVSVIWEVEPGTSVIDKVELPDPTTANFDHPRTLDAFLHAVAWGAITSADPRALQAPFRAGIRIEDYQLEPLVRALSMPRANMLIADDVGIGKTIEAGLVVHEFVLRHRARSCLVVCPSSLQEKWRLEMRDKFGFEFHILDSNTVRQLRRTRGIHVNPLESHPYLITSMDWLKRPEQQPMLDATLPPDTNLYPRKFDLLIVDEAAHVAPAGDGHYATDSQRTQLVTRLSPHFEHRLFLTATPHNGKPESFQALLALIDPQRFARGVRPNAAQLRQVMVRRLKAHIKQVRPDAPFAERRIHALPLTYTNDEIEAYGWLQRYTELRRSAAGGDRRRQTASAFVTLLLKKRFLSSPRAFHGTLEEHLDTLRKTAGTSRRSERSLEATFERASDDYDSEEDAEAAESDALTAAHAAGTVITDEEWQLLEQLRTWAVDHRNAHSSKSKALIDWLTGICLVDGSWTDERVVLFTEYRATQAWLRDLLIDAGLAGDDGERLELIHGSVADEERERINREFNYDPARTPVRILLCTDAASEGIDLHEQCHRVVHVDIPFSPSKMEQRNGRIDRHGQPHPTADCYHFSSTEGDGPALDTYFQDLIVRKVEEIRHDLGSVNDLLDDRERLSWQRLEQQSRRLLTGQQTTLDDPRDAYRSDPRTDVHELVRELEAALADTRGAVADTVDELGITPDEVAHVVNTALTLDHQSTLGVVGDGVWQVPDLGGDWAESLIGLYDPIADIQRPVTFDSQRAASAPGPVYLHLAHPLVARATGLLRAQVWSQTTAESLSRVTARRMQDDALPDDHPAHGHLAIIAHARVVITGGDGSRLHEGVVRVGGRLAERFARFDTIEKTEQVWAARTDEPIANTRMLADAWPKIAESLLEAVHARGEEVARQRNRELERRLADETRQVTDVLTDLRATIQSRLDEIAAGEANPQLSLFDAEERAQFDRDRAALQRRLDEIPDEIERETAALAARYAARDPRVFPISVTFLVPERIAG